MRTHLKPLSTVTCIIYKINDICKSLQPVPSSSHAVCFYEYVVHDSEIKHDHLSRCLGAYGVFGTSSTGIWSPPSSWEMLCGFCFNWLTTIFTRGTRYQNMKYYSQYRNVKPVLLYNSLFQPWCRLITTIYNYFVVTNFFWMFVEGCYLHTAIVMTYSTDKLRKWVFLFIGWCEYHHANNKLIL